MRFPRLPRKFLPMAAIFGLILQAFPAAAMRTADTETLVRTLRERAHKINGFAARLSVQAGGARQSGTLLFLAPDLVHMDMSIPGLGEQRIVSDGRVLWTITPQARIATKVNLEVVRRAWHHAMPNQATAIRDIFETVKPASVRYIRDEAVQAVKTRLFEGVPEIGVEARPNAALPNRVRVWVGEDGLLRRQILMKGTEVLMDATFSITDTNPHIGAGLFTFEPPRDYQVQDLTDSTLQSLRALQRSDTTP